jgi:hypothetical protein
MRNAGLILVITLTLSSISGVAYAQTSASAPENPQPQRSRLQVGVALESTTMPGRETKSSLGPSVIWRWRGRFSRQDDRWALAYRFSSFDSQVSSAVGPFRMPVGDVKVRPLMIGIDYKMPRGRWNWAAGLSAGWAFNSVETAEAYQERARAVAGVGDLWVDVHNSLVWGPRLKGWYDLNRKVSLVVETSYLVTRPSLDIHAEGRRSTLRLNADAFTVKAGVAYGIF